jgi:hypothetical protein
MSWWTERSGTTRALVVSGSLAVVFMAVTSGGPDPTSESEPVALAAASTTTSSAESTSSSEPPTTTTTTSPATTVTTQPTTTTTAPTTTTTTLPEGSFDDGVWLVGSDVEEGRYRSVDASGCYWERLSGLSGDFEEINANGNGTGGPVIVDIDGSDVAFSSSRCGIWLPHEPAEEPVATFAEGDWVVGDIAPGIYTVEDVSGCYWQRNAGFSGSFDDIIANGNVDGRATVGILESDEGFSSSRCGTWEQVDTSVTVEGPNVFGDGVHLVGVHIAPGRYRAEGVTGCYWARLAGVTGGFSDILANDNVDGTATVEIGASDAAFESSRCGEWAPVG